MHERDSWADLAGDCPDMTGSSTPSIGWIDALPAEDCGFFHNIERCRRSSADRAALSYGEGRLFKSTRRHHFPAVVQRSERLNVTQEAGGSTPPPGTNSSDDGGRIPAWGPSAFCRSSTVLLRPSPVLRQWGCSSAVERRSPKPRQRGFDSCLPRQNLDVHDPFRRWEPGAAKGRGADEPPRILQIRRFEPFRHPGD